MDVLSAFLDIKCEHPANLKSMAYQLSVYRHNVIHNPHPLENYNSQSLETRQSRLASSFSGCIACNHKRKPNISICHFFFLIAICCLSLLIFFQTLMLTSNEERLYEKNLIELLVANSSTNSNEIVETTNDQFAKQNQLLDEHYNFNYFYLSEIAHENSKATIDSLWPDNQFDYWQPAKTNSFDKFYVFSAYIDSYNRSDSFNYLRINSTIDDANYFVRIIAVARLTFKDNIICCYQYKHANNSESNARNICRNGKFKPIRENWNLKYSAFFVYCPLPKSAPIENQLSDKGLIASYVSISISSHQLSLTRMQTLSFKTAQQTNLFPIVSYNRLLIHSSGPSVSVNSFQNARMAVCIKPFHYYYNRSINFIEFIELNSLLGVQHFYFYNHTVGSQVDFIIRQYSQTVPQLITVLPWLLPIQSQTEIRTEGIFAALNDCLYRANNDNFEYVLFIDLDEYIIPQHHHNLTHLLEEIRHNYLNANKIGSYSFRNGFFYLQFPDEPVNKIVPDVKSLNLAQHLTTLAKTRRKNVLNIHKQRSKCAVIPRYTVEMGNHFVWESTGEKGPLNVDPSIAYLHHYRVCEFGGNQCIHQSPSIVDRRTHVWANSLVQQIEQRLQTFCMNGYKSQLQICQFII